MEIPLSADSLFVQGLRLVLSAYKRHLLPAFYLASFEISRLTDWFVSPGKFFLCRQSGAECAIAKLEASSSLH